MPTSDHDIIQTLSTCPEKGFRLLMAKYMEPIYWHIRRLVGTHDDAQDAAQETFVWVFRAIGLSVYARADFIVTEDGTPYFLEINTLPGMTPTSLVPQEAAAVGISYGELCQIIVESSLQARKEGV